MFLYIFLSLLKFPQILWNNCIFARKSQKNSDKIIWNSWSVKWKVAQRCTRWGPKNVTVGVPRASLAGVPRVSRAVVLSIWWLGCPDLWKQQLLVLFLCFTMFLEGSQRSFRKSLIWNSFSQMSKVAQSFTGSESYLRCQESHGWGAQNFTGSGAQSFTGWGAQHLTSWVARICEKQL